MFKPKNTKKIIISDKNNITLDSKHNEILKLFKQYEKRDLPKLKKQVKKEKKNLQNKNLTIDEKLDIKDKIKSLNNEINSISKKITDYYLDNSKYIYKYFENKKKIADGTNKTTILNKFFNVDKESNITNNTEITDIQKYLTNVDESYLNINNLQE